MLSSFLILLREALEVSLVVGIVLGFLAKTQLKGVQPFVWFAILAGVLISLAVAGLLQFFVGSFDGPAEQIFEGSTMLLGALLLFPVISWVSHQKSGNKEITSSFGDKGRNLLKWEVFLVVFSAVLRDGVESVLFLGASSLHNPLGNLAGGILGLVSAVVLGWLIFSGTAKIPLKNVFLVTNTLLILFGAGLVARALGEFIEAGFVSGLISPLWNLNPAPAPDGSLSVLHEDGAVGGVFKSLFGYVGAPSLTQIVGYLAYLLLALFLLFKKPLPKAVKA